MAKIYSERETSELYHSTGEPGVGVEARRVAGYGKQLEAQSEQYERRAKDSYSKALNIEWQNSMNEMANNPTLYNNPTAFAKEVKKLNEKMSSEILDDDVKVDFLVNSEIKGASYITNVQNNFIKAQAEREKSILFDSIYNGIETRNLAATNIISGNGTDNDVAAFIGNDIAFQQSVNRTNPDGTYVFSNEQRLKMKRDHENAIVDAFKNAYYNTPDEQKKQFYDSVMKGGKYVVNTKDGKQIEIDAQKMLKPDTFKDIRNSIRDEHYKTLSELKKQKQIEIYEAEQQFVLNPTTEGLETYKKLNPDASERKINRLQEILENSPNYKAETIFDGISSARRELDSIAKLPMVTDKDREHVLDRLSDYVLSINRSNREEKLSTDDVDKLSQMAYRMFNDNVFKEQVHAIFGQPGAFSNFVNWSLGDNAFDRVETLGLQTTQAAINALMNNDPESAKIIYKKGQEEAIKIRYPEIPFENIKVGDIIWYAPTGQALKFMGFGLDDVLVEVDPNTGAKK